MASTVTFDKHAQPPAPTPFMQEPYVYQEYPRWLRRWEPREERRVENEEQRTTLGSDWAPTWSEAHAIYERQQELIANAAAERAFADRRLSPRARAEKLAHERATDQHVTE